MSITETPMTALTIRLEDELFAVEAGRVREILDLVPITEVPNAPAFVGGLINVRGRVVPLADLRVMFGMDRPEPDQDTRIVVMEVDIDGEPTIAGILADKVHDVTDIEPASIEEAPKVGMRWRPEFIKGIGKRNGGFIIIPDMEQIFSTSDGRSPSSAASEERPAS
ncbi:MULTISPECIES: chemotaxis protein CheW [Devosia]|uniref:Chemotaxis protein CheW n=1 Tax=Devosia equisanguinis TaxID=2490941 RepID=A0A3S4GL65_9HYPH|nr:MULTISPECIES: chemotaxis protein CheW [Devosia]ODT50861.1 MAG: chemotaxis protein CheW [Pelagibacterium sp. SCN 63-126]ODU86754.1 MAG: chemotaxis protein CheW [Pelagibacterium sp. SCN 63-17]OJX44478.1 MAG: chemotaxis protein CheW [Devosia sp. 63-57]VDS05540.1 Chemotaxis protein CheW [Devosia equisanguinis]